ncbi:ABC transporter permease [Acutalibacter muris]|uniref:ABC transporter permease n=1 Tax=Acutalibacter muris TaxID=1796620 RepID=UPI0026F393CB|nr:ABC transporter permease [Acutalibacter muris]
MTIIATEMQKWKRNKIVWCILALTLLLGALAIERACSIARSSPYMDNFGDLYTMAFKNLSSLFLPIVLGMFATTLFFDEHKNDTLKELLAGVKVAQYLIDHYDKSNCFEQYCNKLIAVFHKNYPEKNDGNIVEAMKVRKRVAETIENHLCFIFSTVENVDKQKIAVELCKSALAYFMANDEEKALLERMFSVIALKVGKLDHLRLQKYSKTMIGVDLSLQIEKWIVENSLTQRNYSNEQMVNMLISFFFKNAQD